MALATVRSRWIVRALAVGLLVALAGMAMIWMSAHDPARWHVDPLMAERTGRPNDYLLAPEGLSRAAPDRVAPPRPENPESLAARLHAVALAEPRVAVVAGGPEGLFTTYVQRSAVVGFPDYVSVRALPVEGGAGLAVWSRARFGYSDLGVNRARVERWIAALDEDG